MPHMTILYSANLESETDMDVLCRTLADTMMGVKDDAGASVFPTAGIRVLAYPSAHHAVADGVRDYGFVYLNLRIGRGRNAAVHARAGAALLAVTKSHFATLVEHRHVGITLQIDEGAEVFDGKCGNLHALFARP